MHVVQPGCGLKSWVGFRGSRESLVARPLVVLGTSERNLPVAVPLINRQLAVTLPEKNSLVLHGYQPHAAYADKTPIF